MFSDHFTLVEGLSIHHKQIGQGDRPLLVLHGWGGQADSMAPVALAFADVRRVYAIDFPGFGQSDPPNGPWNVTDYTRLLAAWMQKQGLNHCDIIAHSFGCRVSILLAADYPQLVGKLVFTGGAGLIPKRKPSYYFKVYTYKCMKKIAACSGLSRGLKALGLDVEEKIRARAGSEDYRSLSERMKTVFVRVVNQDLRGELPRIKASTLLIWGDQDTDTPLYFGQIMEKEIPDAGLVVFKGEGHFAYLTRGAEFARITRAFLEGA